jgi:hypothetical protein
MLRIEARERSRKDLAAQPGVAAETNQLRGLL